MDTFKLPVEAIQQVNVPLESKPTDMPAKRRYSDEDFKSQPNMKKNMSFPDLDPKFYQEICSVWSNLVAHPEITVDRLFAKEDDENINEQQNDLNINETEDQNTIAENQKSRPLELGTNLQLLEGNEISIFKIPEKRPKRTRTVAKSENQPKATTSLGDAGCEKNEIVGFQLSQTQNVKFSASTSQYSGNGMHIAFECDLDLEYLSNFQNLSTFVTSDSWSRDDRTSSRDSIGKVSRLQIDDADVFPSRSHTDELWSGRDTVGIFPSGSNIAEKSRSRNENVEGFPCPSDADEKFRSRNVTDEKFRSRNVTDEKFRSRNVTDNVLGAQEDFLKVSRSDIDSLVDVDSRQIVSHVSKESFISNRLEVLERHIHYCNSELKAIPPWEPKLTTVIRHLARRRNRETCLYLAMRFKSEKRIPLFEIRKQFIDIFATVEYAMKEILEDVRQALSEGNIPTDTSIIANPTLFWNSVLRFYKDFLSEFYVIRDDYPNFDDVCTSMEEHYNNISEIYFDFYEGVIDLFESF